MTIKEFFTKAVSKVASIATTTPANLDNGIFKAFIPEFLYKPPYGYPRKVNVPALRDLGKNPYVFSVVKTIQDEVSNTPWKIAVKEEFAKDGNDYSEKQKEITERLRHPNGNGESLSHIFRALVKDICEIDSGVIVKVFNKFGEYQQMFVRDSGTILKNPDIYGYMGNRAEYVKPATDELYQDGAEAIRKFYDINYRDQAAYFQYGWIAGSMPIPFGRREIVYMIANPQSHSVYGRSPLEILYDVILTLVYGSKYNLDFYLNNNMPEGIIQLLGAEQEEIDEFTEKFKAQTTVKDSFDNSRRIGYKYPVTNTQANFIQFQVSPKDMEIIAQQKWFLKLVWASFGVTASEMGYEEDSNKNSQQEQSKVNGRKAIEPILDVIKFNFNTQIMTEFDAPELEFIFDDYDIETDIKKHNLYKIQLDLGIKTSEMIAAEEGIDVEALKKSKEEAMEMQRKEFEAQGGEEEENNFGKKKEEPNNLDSKKEDGKKKDKEPEKEKKETEAKALTDADLKPTELGNELKDNIKVIKKNILAGLNKIVTKEDKKELFDNEQ